MFLPPVVYDGALQRQLAQGDFVTNFEPAIPATDTTVTLAYTAAMVTTPTYVRNPAGVSTDTFPTADALLSALQAGIGLSGGVRIGMSWRLRVVNLSANLLTGAVTANTGATMVRGNVLASTSKDFLFQVTNGTPLISCANIGSANASAVLTGFTAAQIANITPGMVVTNAVVGQQGNTVLGVNATALTVTMSGNSNASGPSVFTFSPTYTVTGLAA